VRLPASTARQGRAQPIPAPLRGRARGRVDPALAEPAPHAGGETLIRLGLVGLSVVATLAVAEAGLRVARYAPVRYPSTARLHDRDWTTLLDCYPTNPRGYFDIDLREPAARKRYRYLAPKRLDAIARRAPYAVEFRYNRLGFREQAPEPKPAGVTRVVMLGDSFTEGQGVRERDTCPRRLEAALNQAGGRHWQVRNCGRRAKDFPELSASFEAALQYDPDIVVYAMVLNDPERSPEFHARQTWVNDWILDQGRMEMQGDAPAPTGALDSRLWAFARDRWSTFEIGYASTRWYLEMYDTPNRDGWERTKERIRQMDRRMRARGGSFVLALWPLLVDLGPVYPFERCHDTVREFCRTSGIRFDDLRTILAGRPADSLIVHAVDRHPNEEADRLAARELARVVRSVAR